MTVEPPDEPFFRIGLDHIGPFPKSFNGNKYILVCVCHITRYIEAIPVKNESSSETIRALKSRIIYRHGCPREFLVDRGTSFQSREFYKFCSMFNIRLLSTSSGHPQTNGLVERHNSVIRSVLAKYVNPVHNDWGEILDGAVYSINSTVHSVTKKIPYVLVYGREPSLPCDAVLPTNPKILRDNDIQAESKRRKVELAEAKVNTMEFQRRQQDKFDRSHVVVEYKVGD